MPHHNTKPAVTDGGEWVDSFNEVRNSDKLVRKYSADGRLYAYRDGDQHIVVSEGKDPRTKWEKTIPSTVKRPIPGQRRWTIPDNWNERVRSKRDMIAYSLFYVPESDIWAKVSMPTNDHLVDAWHKVHAVGDLSVDPIGELGSKSDVYNWADEFESQHEGEDGIEEDTAALRAIRDNWDIVEEDLQLATEWVRDEGLEQMQSGKQPIRTGRNWEIEFQEQIFRPLESVKAAVNLAQYDIPGRVLVNILRDGDLLPNPYSFKLGINETPIDMEYLIRALIESGSSPTAALDYYMVEIGGLTQDEWATERQVKQPSVSENISSVKKTLKE